MKSFFDLLGNIVSILLQGLPVVIALTLTSFLVALILGALLGLCSASSSRPLRVMVKVYVYVFRSIPFLMFLMLIFYGLPYYGIELGPYGAAILALSLNHAAYIAEIVRGGLNAFDFGQEEAAIALGFSRFERLRKIILPQVLIAVVPSLLGQTILMIKDTSVVSIIGISEITQLGKAIVVRTYQPFLVFAVVAVIYYLLCLLLQYFSLRSEKGLRRLLSGV